MVRYDTRLDIDSNQSNYDFFFRDGLGNGLMDEKEFRTWITRIQALRDETSSSPSTSKAMTQSEIDDDASQDLIAAFR